MRFGGQVQDRSGPILAEQLPDKRQITNVALDEPDPLDEVGEVGEVAQRLRHLLALDLDETVVHPAPGERPAAGDRLGLKPPGYQTTPHEMGLEGRNAAVQPVSAGVAA